MNSTPLISTGKPLALTDWAFESIKDSILNLTLPPGVQLQVEQLATQMGISRTPVREALLRLERDGFVQVLPRVGFFVTGIDPKDLEELYELRELLESRAVRDAVPRLSDEELAHLNQLVEYSKVAIEEQDTEKFLETEIAFHTFLTDHSQNRRLIAIIESFRDLTYRWRKLAITSFQDVRVSYDEHCQINAAVQQKNASLASQLMGEHIRAAQLRISQIIQHQGMSNLKNHPSVPHYFDR